MHIQRMSRIGVIALLALYAMSGPASADRVHDAKNIQVLDIRSVLSNRSATDALRSHEAQFIKVAKSGGGSGTGGGGSAGGGAGGGGSGSAGAGATGGTGSTGGSSTGR